MTYLYKQIKENPVKQDSTLGQIKHRTNTVFPFTVNVLGSMNPPSKPLPLLAVESSQPDAISDLISTLNSLFPRCLIFDFSAVCNTWFIHSFNSTCHIYSVSTMYETAGIKRWKPSAPWPEEAKVSDWTPAVYSIFP